MVMNGYCMICNVIPISTNNLAYGGYRYIINRGYIVSIYLVAG